MSGIMKEASQPGMRYNVLVDDTDPVITNKIKALFNVDLSDNKNKGSVWINRSSGSAYKGTLKYSNYPGDYVEFTFFGTAIKWIGPKGENFGKADVFIDGVPVGEVDCYSEDGWTDRQVLYSKTGLAYGKHSIKIVVKGEKSSCSSDAYVGIDAFEYKTR